MQKEQVMYKIIQTVYMFQNIYCINKLQEFSQTSFP